MPFADYKTALVTGASSGIGAATVERLRGEGLEVHALARNAANLDELARAVREVVEAAGRVVPISRQLA